jgi:hypothetical protein
MVCLMSRLLVRVRQNLEWVLASEDSHDEPPLPLWAEYACDDGTEPSTFHKSPRHLGGGSAA